MAFGLPTPLPWWMYLIAIGGSVLIGALIASVGFFVYSKIQNRKQKKGIPKDKAEVSQWLKQEDTKSVMLNPGRPTQIDKKEAEQYERTKFDKYREFEKLRRVAQGKGSTINSPGFYESSFEQSERRSLQNEPDKRSASFKTDESRPSGSGKVPDNDDGKSISFD